MGNEVFPLFYHHQIVCFKFSLINLITSCIHCIFLVFFYCYILILENKVAPYNITGVAWNESSIKVDWEFAISHWTGPSLLFYVFWKEVTDDFADYTTYQNSTVFNQSVIFTNDRYFYIESPDINGLFSFFITGLKPFTNYSVVLQTYNPIGFGKASDVFFFRSGEWCKCVFNFIISERLFFSLL